MALEERDPFTGELTTGHEWNGIKELNTAVPRVVWFFLILTTAISIICWILYPAWPLGSSYTRGVLDTDQTKVLASQLLQAQGSQANWRSRIAASSFEEIEDDAQLMELVGLAGHRLYGDNCAACHGKEGQGAPGFPNLRDTAWLWGGRAEEIAETIRVGINSAHPDSRSSQMPAFGHDQILDRASIGKVVSYVTGLSNAGAPLNEGIPDPEGRKIFADNCSTCHGEDARGTFELGAPDLTDRTWIYGGDVPAVRHTVWAGCQGQMPSWEDRLDEVDRKILTVFVHTWPETD